MRAVYIAVTVAAGGALVLYASVVSAATAITALVLFAAASAAAEYFQVDGADDPLDPADARTFSFSSGVHFAAAVVAGPLVAATAAAFGVLLTDRVRGHERRRVAFNASTLAISAAVGGWAFAAAGGAWGSLSLPDDLPALAAMALAYTIVDKTLVAVVFALGDGSPVPRAIWNALRFDTDSDVAEAAIGGLLAFLLLAEPWAIVMISPLGFAAYQAHRRLKIVRRETARALETFANVVDERDPYTYRHSERVADYVRGLAEALALPPAEIARLRWAGRLHDLGKIGVDGGALRRHSSLTEAEWSTMKRHPRLSSRIIRRFHLADEQARAVEFHHERFDGEGYYGVSPRSVPLASHFLVVADTFDAMTSDRPYRRALSEEVALTEIERCAGSQFHPLVARAFVAHRRGQDPREILTRAERAELSRVFGRRSFAVSRLPRVAPDTIFLVAVCVGMASFAAGLRAWPLTVVAFGVAIAAAAKLAGGARAARALRQAVGTADFRGLVDALAASTPLAWAGLVRWEAASLEGSVVTEWDVLGARPHETALTSWFVREADAYARPFEIDGHELGSAGRFIAVQVGLERTQSAILVLGFADRMPFRVRRLLADVPQGLASALASPVAAPRPALRAAS